MTKRLVLALLTCASLLALAPAAGAVELTKLGSTPAQGEAQAEIAAYDPQTEQAFVTNAEDNSLDIYDFSNPTDLGDPVAIDLSPYGAGPNSVAVSRDGLVAVAVEADPITAPGTVEIFDTDGNHMHSFPAGSLPDMLTFAEHDKYLLVANEGEALSDEDDPQGSVTVIKLNKKLSKSTIKTAGFAGVPRVGEYRIACPGTPFVQDAEPEYIAEGGFGTAVVTLQEVNAVGVLDIERGRFVLVRGLGYKDHGKARNALDPSDEDGGININPWEGLEGMYQPDAIASYTWFGLPYYVTANEGDARERDGCEEEDRAGDLDLDPTAFPNAAELQDDAALGRLNVSTTTGDTDGDGDFDRLFSFGARSFSILGPLGGILWDSGAQLERIAAAEEPDRFNFSNEEPGELDERSDSKGSEPEGIDVGTVGFRTYAFVASERQGGIYAYRLQGPSASFEDYLNARPDDLGPEGVQFVSRSDSPTGRAMLLVTNEISGTVTAIDVAP